MIEKEFMTIEKELQSILLDFLKNTISEDENDLRKSDTIGLLKCFTRNFDELKTAMNWQDKEMLNRAFLIIGTRNKYYHRTPASESNNNKAIELEELLNIYVFCTKLKERINNIEGYQGFMEYLDDLFISMIDEHGGVKVESDEENNNKTDTKYEELINLNIELKEKVESISYQVNNLNKLMTDKNEQETEKPKEPEETYSVDTKINSDNNDNNKKTLIGMFYNLLTKYIEIGEYDLEEWYDSINPQIWKTLARIAKLGDLLTPNERNLLYNMGVYSLQGKKPTKKQLEYAHHLFNRMVKEIKTIMNSMNNE